jgi:uncharacterized protein YfaS (alpha-2-macroglobulin family)
MTQRMSGAPRMARGTFGVARACACGLQSRLPGRAITIDPLPAGFEAFTTLLQPGRGDIVYLALATTPGDFAAPAPRAEEMYAPETFGRGAAERVVIEVVEGRN